MIIISFLISQQTSTMGMVTVYLFLYIYICVYICVCVHHGHPTIIPWYNISILIQELPKLTIGLYHKAPCFTTFPTRLQYFSHSYHIFTIFVPQNIQFYPQFPGPTSQRSSEPHPLDAGRGGGASRHRPSAGRRGGRRCQETDGGCGVAGFEVPQFLEMVV